MSVEENIKLIKWKRKKCGITENGLVDKCWKLESYHDADNRPRPVSVSPVKEFK